MTKKNIRFLLCLSLAPGFARAGRDFEAHTIPEAQCGDGSTYRLFIRPGDPKKFVFHFQGGGACWNWNTCYGPRPFTRLNEGVSSTPNTLSDALPEDHELGQATYVYVPYCTGDIFAGNHEATYGGRRVLHRGRANTELAVEWLKRNTQLQEAESAILYGESAGAIGALVNLDLFETSLPKSAKRYLISDAPGLHFSETIWIRFSDYYIDDLSKALERNGMRFHRETGVLAPEVKHYCELYPHWRVGILQGSRDLVMSSAFGNRTPIDHELQVYGSHGIHATLLDPSDTCASWAPSTQEHVFLTNEDKRKTQSSDGVSATAFAREVLDASYSELASHK